MFIRSERLFLRPGWPEDWKELSAHLSDTSSYSTHWMHRAKKLVQGDPHAHDCPAFLVTLPSMDDTRIIGFVGFASKGLDASPQFWIAPDYRGHGYASEALEAVLCLARTLGHQRLVADVAYTNFASARVLQKAGFMFEANAGDAAATVYVRDLQFSVVKRRWVADMLPTRVA